MRFGMRKVREVMMNLFLMREKWMIYPDILRRDIS